MCICIYIYVCVCVYTHMWKIEVAKRICTLFKDIELERGEVEIDQNSHSSLKILYP